MSCNLRLEPSWDEHYKGRKPIGWSLSLRFDSVDDDIMYECFSHFNSYEEAKAKMSEVKSEFEKCFLPAYRSKKRIYDATKPKMEELFQTVR